MNKKMMRTLSAIFLLVSLFCLNLNAQITCDYRLELNDSFGDSWDGAVLLLTFDDGSTELFTHQANSGFQSTFTIPVTEGDSLKIEFFGGSFDGEVSYQLFDTDDNLLFEDGPNPTIGLVYADTIVCPSCPPPSIEFFSFDNIRAEFVDISFLGTDPNGTYTIQYDTTGFDPSMTGFELIVNQDEARIRGLQEKTIYDLYITAFCASGDTSSILGPITFETVFKNDVGVTSITTPQTGCGLEPFQEVEITFQNFGANPQTLFEYDFSINGVPGGVSMPNDGFFTGVLGKDSTFTLKFETRANVGEPNEYEILAWTVLEGDSDLSNDTTSFTIVNIPLIDEFPYFTDFETWFDGWIVDDTISRQSSWEFGRPSYQGLVGAASGQNAWVTAIDTTYNNSEASYLVSPCLDFSGLDEDPRVSFSLFVQTEERFDRAWLELSIDDGATWTKTGDPETGLNWYNDEVNLWWSGDGGFEGWRTASNILLGAAGAADARLRFVFASDAFTAFEGVGIDDFFLSQPLDNDLAALRVSHSGDENCGEARDEVTIEILNQGKLAQMDFEIAYQVNDGDVVIEPFDGTLDPNETGEHEFSIPFSSIDFGVYTIRAWTINTTENYFLNDTVTYTFSTARSIPYIEDFEEARLPMGWEVLASTENTVTNGHNAPSYVLSGNIYDLVPIFDATSPAIGPIENEDTLRFDYRFVDFAFGGGAGDPTKLNEADSMLIQISTDCGLSFTPLFVINESNHTPTVAMTTVELPLEAFVGEFIRVKFTAFWGEGDYYVDIDNINVLRCPETLELNIVVVDESKNGAMDGSISITPNQGFVPFAYRWSNDERTKNIIDLETGIYTVTVSDAIGCQETVEIEVGLTTSVQTIDAIESVSLAPNPTNGLVTLNLQLEEPLELEIAVFNAVGQQIQVFQTQKVAELTQTIDMSQAVAGMYFVSIQVQGAVHIERLILLE